MMSGMLVPVQPVSKAMRAVETLFGVDPEFVLLCKTLYGPDVDPVEVWTDVFGKDEPGGSDMHVTGNLQVDRRFAGRRRRVRKEDDKRRALEAAGIGATVIGGALGVKELAEQAPKARGMLRNSEGYITRTPKGRLVPGPVARVAGVSGMLGGDAAATVNQVQSSRRKKANPAVATAVQGTKAARDVSKAGLGELADGFEAGMRRHLGALIPKAKAAAGDVKAGVGAARSGQQAMAGTTSRAYRAANATTTAARSAVGDPMQTFFGSKKRTAATVGAAGATGYALSRKPTSNTTAKRYEEEDLDVVWAGEFEKFDEDKRLVFGWASVVELNGTPVVDRQGDYIHPDDLENASYEYVIKSRVGGDMHSRDGDIPLKVSDLVESVVITPEKLRHMGIPEQIAKNMPTGWWVGFKVHSDKHWDLVKKRARGGFSIHGRGKRVPMSIDSIMPGYH